MAPTHEHTSVLLLERPVLDRPVEEGRPRLENRLAGGPAQLPAGRTSSHETPAPQPPLLRSPAFGLAAALSILEGYWWLGIMPAGDSSLSSFATGRIGALVFASLMLLTVWAMTRPDAGGRRPAVHRLVVSTAVVAVGAAVVLLASGATAATHAVGVSDLVLASASAGALIAAERDRHRALRPVPGASGGSGPSDHAVPVA